MAERSATVAELAQLSPQHIADRLQALAADLQLAYSPSTLKGWRADWRIWSAFCQRQGWATVPADVDQLRAFLQAGVDAGKARATLSHYLATLGLVHRLAGVPWAMDSIEGQLMWRGLRRTQLPSRQRQAAAIRLDALEQMIAAMNVSVPADARDAALLTVAYEAMARESELVAFDVQDFSVEKDGSGRLLIERSKTDQEAEGVKQYLSQVAVERIRNWLAIADIEDGPLFRSVPRRRHERFRSGLDVRDVDRIFKGRAEAAGLDPSGISGHSTRVGAAQDLMDAGFTLGSIMKQGRWRNERMVLRYTENLVAARGAMAKYLHRARRVDSSEV